MLPSPRVPAQVSLYIVSCQWSAGLRSERASHAFQVPDFKFQARFGIWDLEFVWNLGFGI